jgi:hypothetical protein
MCDTQEHIKIGEKAFGWALSILKSGHAGPAYAWVNDQVGPKYAAYPGVYPKGRPILFLLTNGAQVSYGDILGLAGDFYPEYAQIFADREEATKGHELLLDSAAVAWDNPKIPHKAEIEGVLDAYHKRLADKTWSPKEAEAARPGPAATKNHGDLGRVLRLALDNPDHFGIEAVEKWERYHRLACAIAAEGRRYYESGDLKGYEALSGDGLPAKRGEPCEPNLRGLLGKREYPLINSLWLALRYNAFGDHFLSDLFSSGHMRTPRLELMKRFPREEFCLSLGSLGMAAIGSAKVDLASVLSGIQHDEDGKIGLWAELLLGKLKLGSLGMGCPPLEVDQFFARGDGHYLNPVNADARALCYRAVALSIRDVLFASLIGKDPRQASHYWGPFGGKAGGAGARWAALRLVPRPLDPSPRWKYEFYLKRRDGDAYCNHQALAKPEQGLASPWKRLKEYVTASDGAIPARGLDTHQFRQTEFKFHHISYMGTDLGDPETMPGTSATYYDLREWITRKTNFFEHIGQDEWWTIEMGRLVSTYLGYKLLKSEPHDNSAAGE